MDRLSPVVLAIPVYFLLIGIELLVQYMSGKKLYRLKDALANISCGIVQQLSGIFLKVFSVGIYVLVYENLRIATVSGTWISWVILFIAVDFLYYWAHRMSHEVNLFWGGHVVHHQSEDYNFSVALRQSSFQVIWTFAFYLPLAFVGFNPVDFLFINALTTVYQFWIHTETIGKLGFLESFLNTPSHHRVHHGRDPKYIDRNHAGVFIIWDKMFGTFQKEEEKPTYGITRPLQSWNPVWANFEHYSIMWGELNQIRGFKNKLYYLINKPGWLPSELGGYRAPESIRKETYSKYESPSPPYLRIYILVQFILVLIVTAFFIFSQSLLSSIQIWVFASVIVLSAATFGGLSDNKRWAYAVEFGRLGILLGSLIVFGLNVSETLLVLIAVAVTLLSIVFYLYILYVKNRVSS